MFTLVEFELIDKCLRRLLFFCYHGWCNECPCVADMYIRDYMYVIQCIAASSCWYIGCQEWKVRVGSHCFHARFGPLFIGGIEVLQNIGSKLKRIFFVDDYIRWFNLSKV